MSVVTAYEMRSKTGSLFARLEQEGAIAPADLYVSQTSGYRHYEHVLDLEKVDKRIADSEHKRWDDFKAENPSLISADSKFDPTKVPVYLAPQADGKDDDNAVVWMVNYGSNDAPAAAISRHYPNDIFSFKIVTEQHLDAYVHLKNGVAVTPDGRSYESAIPAVGVKQIGTLKDGKYPVKLPVDNTDARFATVYFPQNDVVPHADFDDGRRNLIIRNADAPFRVYRMLSDNQRVVTVMSGQELADAVDKCRVEFARQKMSGPSKMAAQPTRSDRRLPDTSFERDPFADVEADRQLGR